MHEILEDLKINLQPYYVHFYNILHQLETEYIQNHRGSTEDGLRSMVLNDLKLKVKKELEQK